jgi:hypothetical protein
MHRKSMLGFALVGALAMTAVVLPTSRFRPATGLVSVARATSRARLDGTTHRPRKHPVRQLSRGDSDPTAGVLHEPDPVFTRYYRYSTRTARRTSPGRLGA